ncbi:G-box-binding factor isoform X10 [Aedes albopictus]|uniref:glycogenin glucosyltransferase n=1 Tax=Aedes albopictus TaxID=7160 RepID=A0ABM1ZS66_AEDAL
MSNFAWVTLATNDSYSLGALVVAHSLKRVHTAHQLAVLITPGVSEAMKNKLRTIFNVVEEVNLLDSKDEANLALLKRPELGITFTKLHCWRLTQFEKCVFLDADTLVLRNCDELFEREELSAAPDVGWPDCFNSGVYVYRPSLDTFSSLMQYAVTHGSFDGGDQGLLNSYFSDWAHKDISKHLPFIYNTSSVASYSYLPAFKQFGQNTKILHFIGTAKPWLQNFNSESRKVYIPGGYQHLANFLQYWWDIFCEDVHSRLSADMSDLNNSRNNNEKSTEQWVENVHRHDHSGHWDPEPARPVTWQPESVQQGGGGGGGDQYQHHQHQEHHHHHQQQQHGDHHQPERHDHHGHGGGGEGTRADDHQHHHQQSQQDHPSEQQQPQQEQHPQGGGEGSGLAGALSQLHLGEPKSTEQEVYEEHMRRQCWESGNIDYMGRDSFENIWRRITQTVSAGPSPVAESAQTPAASTTPLRAISPAPPRRSRSSKSRSRSTTPKRDPRDRSPTPQPEDIVPVEKKEVQIEASIQEEEDNLNVASLDESAAECRKLPPPVQYDPMTSTTTLTKKVFAGYQQIITTKTPEGKTRTRTKTVYDPSVDDEDVVDGPMFVTSATVAESRIKPAMPLVEPETEVITASVTSISPAVTPTLKTTPVTPTAITTSVPTAPKASPAPPTSKTTPPPAPVPESEKKPTPSRASPRPQLEQQVAQESMAGKEPSVEPIKTVRRKRLASPQAPSAVTTSTATQTTASTKPKTKSKSTVALKTASAVAKTTTPSPSTPAKPKATPQEPTKTKPATPSQSPAPSKSQSLPSPSSSVSSPPPPPPTSNLSSTNGRPKPTKKSIEEIETAPLTANDELDNDSAPVTPQVPPRRKRETKVSRIVQVLTSTTSCCYNAVKSVVRTTFNVAVDALTVFSLLVVCYGLATFTPSIES